MKPYHPANLKHLPYANWRVIVLAWVGKALGITFHVHGIPFGAAPKASPHAEMAVGQKLP